MANTFVPSDFVAPVTFEGPGFRMEPLGPEHNERDHEAWMSSIDHIRAKPTFADTSWPAAMSLEDNLSDLEAHAKDFEARTGFTYSILDGDDVIGCVYVYPSSDSAHDANMTWWVTESRSEMEAVIGPLLNEWITSSWPFENPSY